MSLNDVIQYVLAGLIVAAAVFAVGRALWRAAHGKKTQLTACAACKLQDICRKPEKNSVKKCADKVAQVKN
jgi:hypothetical protein